MIRTFLDAGVLIAAVRGQPEIARRVFDLLEDPEREFCASVFLRLEVLPKAIFQQRAMEVAFYHGYFDQVIAWAEPIDHLVDFAEREAGKYGLSALDALHVAAATMLAADELVSTEGRQKPMHRVADVKVIAF